VNQLAGVDGPPRGSIYVEVSPDRTEPFDNVTVEQADQGIPPGRASLLDELRAAYENRVARYDRELADAEKRGGAATGNRVAATSSYPALRVTLCGEETLLIDSELYEHLFEIYVYHGWAGIHRVQEAIFRAASTRVESRWTPALGFFAFTRDLLARLVRDSLAELEQRAATHIIGNLSLVAARVSEAWRAKYRITRAERTVTRGVNNQGRPFAEQVVTYSFGNREESKALFTALTQAVEQRVAYEKLLQDIALARGGVRYIRGAAQRTRELGRPFSGDRALSADLDLKEQELHQLDDRSAGFYAGMQQLIGLNSPLGLLVLEGLTPGFTQARMEDLLGASLWELYASIDVLGAGIDPQLSRVASLLAKDPGKGRPFPPGGPEAVVIDAAVKLLPHDPAWFALLHSPSLNLLVESDEIPRDSFTFVVFGHYVIALEKRLEAEAQAEEASKAFWKAFSKVAAAASLLLLLVTPPVAAAARGAVLVFDLAMLAHTVSSVTQQLTHLDELRDQQLLHPEAFSVECLGRLGQLGVFRRGLMAHISQQLVIELTFIASGAQWALVQELLMFRGYLQDVETLDFGED
jgi:hypothetical protein